MAKKTDLTTLLTKLGWGSYEASAYAVLIENGAMKANDIAIKAKIPMGRIYDTLQSLEIKRGGLRKRDTRPSLYDAQHPRHVLTREKDNISKDIDDILPLIEDGWELRSTRNNFESEKAWTVSGAHGIVIEIQQLIEKAKKSIKIIDDDISWLSHKDYNDIKEIIKNNHLELKVISTEKCIQELKKIQTINGTVRRRTIIEYNYYITDNSNLLIKLNKPETGVIVLDKGMTRICLEKFDQLFKESKELDGDKIAS